MRDVHWDELVAVEVKQALVEIWREAHRQVEAVHERHDVAAAAPAAGLEVRPGLAEAGHQRLDEPHLRDAVVDVERHRSRRVLRVRVLETPCHVRCQRVIEYIVAVVQPQPGLRDRPEIVAGLWVDARYKSHVKADGEVGVQCEVAHDHF